MPKKDKPTYLGKKKPQKPKTKKIDGKKFVMVYGTPFRNSAEHVRDNFKRILEKNTISKIHQVEFLKLK